MAEVWFYHLTESAVEDALPALLSRAAERGWRIELRGTVPERMESLDRLLWLGADESFFAHGLAGGSYDALQPVLLTVAGQGAANEPSCLMTIDRARVTPEEARRLERSCIIFAGSEPAAVEEAREQWRDLTASGLAASYWKQEDGRWTLKNRKEATE